MIRIENHVYNHLPRRDPAFAGSDQSRPIDLIQSVRDSWSLAVVGLLFSLLRQINLVPSVVTLPRVVCAYQAISCVRAITKALVDLSRSLWRPSFEPRLSVESVPAGSPKNFLRSFPPSYIARGE